MAIGYYGWNKGSLLPEFGVTETIGDWFGVPRDPNSGGSMLDLVASQPTSPTYQTQPSVSYDVADWSPRPENYQAPTTTTSSPTGEVLGTNTDVPSGDTAPTIDPFIQWLDEQYSAQEGYINEFEQGLGSKKTGMEDMAKNTWQQGKNTLDTQYSTNKTDLQDYQTRTLRDITDSLRSMWEQGNRMLGGRGASDSSAANMYSYAIGKAGAKQRGDTMQDVSRRLGNLKQVYDTNTQNLELDYNNQLTQISQWFTDAQTQVAGMRADLQQSKSQEILNLAIQALNDARANMSQKQSILDSWAAEKARSLPELRAMLAANAAALPTYQGLGANMQFGGTAQSPNLFGFSNQGQDSVDWMSQLLR